MGLTLSEYCSFTYVCLCNESLYAGLLHIKANGVWMCVCI